jgi:hypothetical protein
MPGIVVQPDDRHRAPEERRREELEQVVAVVDEFAAAHTAYETMPPRPAVGAFGRETVEWEQRRLELERRCYRANRAWGALVRERMALLGGEA